MKLLISQVHVVFKTHLDLGFTDYARNVLRRYITNFIPNALKLAHATRDLPERFVWTMGSWLVYQFLEKAGPQDRKKMEEAIAAGDIYWHALPFTTHTELMDEPLFRQGLRYSQILDSRFGRKTRAAKMTDVPGHTKAILRPLAENGVRLLHIGVNPASTVPDIPPVFVWRSESSEVVIIYEKVYGATTVLPGGMALSVNLTGDNLGPQNPDDIKGTYVELRKRFPEAAVTAGSLDSVIDLLWSQRKSLPVITSEIGDTWIHGVGTDPAKVAQFRCLTRLRSKWLAEKKITAGDEVDFPFAENLLLTAEHTWGMDIKTHLRDSRIFSPQTLSRSLEKPNFKAVTASWREQRAYVKNALASLPPQLATEAKTELAAIDPRHAGPNLKTSKPSSGWKTLPLAEPFHIGPWEVSLGSDGAIRSLRRGTDSHFLADDDHRLASFAYQLFSPADYQRFYKQYNTLDVDWARRDFTKPGLPQVKVAGWHCAELTELRIDSAKSEAMLKLRFPDKVAKYGAPADATIFLHGQEDGIDVRLEWRDKPANRIPEALWLSFCPKLVPNAAWRFEKLGTAIDPLDVVGKGSRHLHAVSGPVTAEGFSLFSLDTALVAPGVPSLLDFDNRLPDLAAGVSFNLYNNVWGTNFPMWYSDDAVFRFRLRWTGI